ncbi:MAG TPA: homoprotocatechuate degradation operon regulator HpaR [Caulobacteraceae bacterium]|jgi:homoprotocatechuate degradation regulator HpaR
MNTSPYGSAPDDADPDGSDSEPLPPVAQSLPVRLLRTREAVMIRIRPVLRVHGVTEQQWRVLCTVRDLEETEITVLAERVFLLAPSLSRILRDLEARGLIRRRASTQDQRRALVSITPEGEALIHRVEPALLTVRLEMRRLCGADRLKALAEMLQAIEDALGPGLPSLGD